MKRRVQAFVLLAIAVFVSGGIAARSAWTARHTPSPATTPARDVVVPSPDDAAAGRPPALAHPPSSAGHPSAESTGPSELRLEEKSAPPHATRRPSRSTASSSGPSAASAKGDASSKGASAEAEAVRLTNAQRAQHGCSALHVDVRLRTAARLHSADMRDRHYFEHDSPDGKTPWDRIKAAGYAVPGAENIAMGYSTAQAVLQGWMNSPGHRANILNCKLKAVGIGVEYGPGGPWWTQDFGFQ